MTNSGGLEKDGHNSLLDAKITAQNERGVVVLPTLYVNTQPLRGQLTAPAVYQAVCGGFEPDAAPVVCRDFDSCETMESTCDELFLLLLLAFLLSAFLEFGLVIFCIALRAYCGLCTYYCTVPGTTPLHGG
jgi:hypothetical protein